MNIKFDDTNLYVDYVCNYLNEHYNGNLSNNYNYEIHNKLIDYINLSTTVSYSDLIDELESSTKFILNNENLFNYFTFEYKISSIQMKCKKADLQVPTYIKSNMSEIISYIMSFGWKPTEFQLNSTPYYIEIVPINELNTFNLSDISKMINLNTNHYIYDIGFDSEDSYIDIDNYISGSYKYINKEQFNNEIPIKTLCLKCYSDRDYTIILKTYTDEEKSGISELYREWYSTGSSTFVDYFDKEFYIATSPRYYSSINDYSDKQEIYNVKSFKMSDGIISYSTKNLSTQSNSILITLPKPKDNTYNYDILVIESLKSKLLGVLNLDTIIESKTFEFNVYSGGALTDLIEIENYEDCNIYLSKCIKTGNLHVMFLNANKIYIGQKDLENIPGKPVSLETFVPTNTVYIRFDLVYGKNDIKIVDEEDNSTTVVYSDLTDEIVSNNMVFNFYKNDSLATFCNDFYYNDPWLLHKRLIQTLLGHCISEYSEQEDIHYIQQAFKYADLINYEGLKFNLNYLDGHFNDALKNDIITLQKFKNSIYSNGIVYPDIELELDKLIESKEESGV